MNRMDTETNKLTAGRAFALFALFIVSQLLAGIEVGLIIGVVAALRGINPQAPENIARISQQAAVLGSIFGALASAVIVLFFSIRWFPGEITKGSATGAAWRIGLPKFIVLGAGAGVLIAVGYLLLAPLMSHPSDKNTAGPFAKMATTPGMQQIIACIIALIIAPPVEELLFRGVMFGGISRSFGVVWSAILTTALFVASHVIEAVHFWPAFVFIALMASAALWLRVHTKSIGPSIALHFSYNLILMGTTFFTS